MDNSTCLYNVYLWAQYIHNLSHKAHRTTDVPLKLNTITTSHVTAVRRFHFGASILYFWILLHSTLRAIISLVIFSWGCWPNVWQKWYGLMTNHRISIVKRHLEFFHFFKAIKFIVEYLANDSIFLLLPHAYWLVAMLDCWFINKWKQVEYQAVVTTQFLAQKNCTHLEKWGTSPKIFCVSDLKVSNKLEILRILKNLFAML